MQTIQLDEESKVKVFGKTVYKGIMSGISYMIPVVIFGGLLMALVDIIGMEILGYNLRDVDEVMAAGGFELVLYNLRQVSFVALSKLMYPVLCGFIAYGIAGKSALAPGLVAGYLAGGYESGALSVANSGFLGALFAGALAGYLVLWIRSFRIKAQYESLMNLLVIPVVVGIAVCIPMVWGVGPFISFVNAKFTEGLTWMADNNLYFAVGVLIGLMANFDFGGPINKIAYMFAVGLWTDGHWEFYCAFTIAKIIPGITLGLAALLFKNLFTEEERDTALPSIVLAGLGGIGEQCIPYAIRDPLGVIPAQMAGGAIAGGLSMLWNIKINVGAGGSLLTSIATSSPVQFLICFAIGAAVAFVLMVGIKTMRYNRKAAK